MKDTDKYTNIMKKVYDRRMAEITLKEALLFVVDSEARQMYHLCAIMEATMAGMSVAILDAVAEKTAKSVKTSLEARV